MTHRHEWEIDCEIKTHPSIKDLYSVQYWGVCGCGGEMTRQEIERRLNATEFLSAEDAEAIWSLKGGDRGKLLDYAKTLRGE